MAKGSLETSTSRARVKKALFHFFDDMELEVKPLGTHASQTEIRQRIMTARFYLGDLINKDSSYDTRFLRRLYHPKQRGLNTPGQLIRGEVRRRRRRNRTARGKAMRLYRVCLKISNAHPRYRYGGGHAGLLRLLRSNSDMDCSSSTSLALKRAHLFNSPIAWVSGLFKNWGNHGYGEYFTIQAHDGHVWIEFAPKLGKGHGEYRRFDTSPHGDGPSGARMRKSYRPISGFEPRHIPGL